MIDIYTEGEWIRTDRYNITVSMDTDDEGAFTIAADGQLYFADEIGAVSIDNPSDLERALLQAIHAIMRG